MINAWRVVASNRYNQSEMITINLNRVGVLEAVATEFNSTGCVLNNIYINQPPIQYSQE